MLLKEMMELYGTESAVIVHSGRVGLYRVRIKTAFDVYSVMYPYRSAGVIRLRRGMYLRASKPGAHWAGRTFHDYCLASMDLRKKKKHLNDIKALLDLLIWAEEFKVPFSVSRNHIQFIAKDPETFRKSTGKCLAALSDQCIVQVGAPKTEEEREALESGKKLVLHPTEYLYQVKMPTRLGVEQLQKLKQFVETYSSHVQLSPVLKERLAYPTLCLSGHIKLKEEKMAMLLALSIGAKVTVQGVVVREPETDNATA